MTQTQSNKSADTIRYLGVKGVIWRNDGKDGKPDRYSVQYGRTYRDEDGNYHDTSSLSEIDNLKLEIVRVKVATRIAELKAADRQAARDDEDDEAEGWGQ
ncbi:hypothetical protein FYK55_21990 [Roseiconus nitratireducens]|uniref:Uncharacterized protein n=1 Tax=Roseiconus nitratireducens TaxID=2605748 RepID=A0A5M6CYP1_9BACT|nr:hypothetical protein [Roseiconus nitratireducens]KAA5539996.1 hypothetical protein FYK55_21990 [Roseiconus nitratireducens]